MAPVTLLAGHILEGQTRDLVLEVPDQLQPAGCAVSEGKCVSKGRRSAAGHTGMRVVASLLRESDAYERNLNH